MFIFISATALITSYVIIEENIFSIYSGILILFLLFTSLTVEFYDNKARHNEICNRISTLLQRLQRETKDIKWLPQNYPHLFAPLSPCITLQWTYRDNKIVNLPWALLVKDDVVLMRPGQISPGYCEAIEKNSEYPLLHAKEVFGSNLQNANEIFSAPKSHKPLESKRYRLLETPYLNNLRTVLEQALDRPVSQENQQRHFVMIKILERFVLPLSLFLVYTIYFIRYMYIENIFGKISATDLFIFAPISTILPLLPIIFPVIWILLNYVGVAK